MRVSRLLASRAMPRASPARLATRALSAQFDGETSNLYARAAEMHAHPDGPWAMMLAATKQALPATEALTSGRPGADAPRILDLATGPGEPAVTIARALPGAAVTASDVSEDMIAKAEARIEAAGVARNCEAARMSFEDLGRVPSDSVDVATCCYGYMFAGDAPTAFAETFRVLKPGGALVMTHWKDVAFMRLVGAVTAAARGPGAAPPPPPAINPLALAEAGKTEKLLADAGFVVDGDGCSRAEQAYPFELGADEEFAFKLSTLPTQAAIDALKEERGADVVMAATRAAFEEHVAAHGYRKPGGIVVEPNVFVMTVAVKPSATKQALGFLAGIAPALA